MATPLPRIDRSVIPHPAQKNAFHPQTALGRRALPRFRKPRGKGLAEALREGRLRLYHQPILPVTPPSGESQAAAKPFRTEILLRLIDGKGTCVSAEPWIDAETPCGVMAHVDRWVIETTFEHLSHLSEEGALHEVSINLSACSVTDEGLPEFVAHKMAKHSIDPSWVCFEISEHVALNYLDKVCRTMLGLRREGCRSALDGVESGFATYARLRAMPIDYLKIDGSLVCNLGDDMVSQFLVETLSRIGQAMGLTMAASSIESLEAMEILRCFEIEYAQGFALSPPAPLQQWPGVH